MNKLYITTAIALASVTFASAQMGGVNQERENRPQVTTLSGPVGEQIKALNREMESRIQAIRDEYMIKIKNALEAAKVNRPASTTTPLGMVRGEKRGMDEGRKMGVPFDDSTSTRPMMEDDDVERPQQNRQQDGLQIGTQIGLPNFINFLRGFFGRGNQ
ncbi:MAG: hypothetical protein WCT07_00830 [Candidatus Paceibacterota bacterium]|jgi:hypothetical protein